MTSESMALPLAAALSVLAAPFTGGSIVDSAGGGAEVDTDATEAGDEAMLRVSALLASSDSTLDRPDAGDPAGLLTGRARSGGRTEFAVTALRVRVGGFGTEIGSGLA